MKKCSICQEEKDESQYHRQGLSFCKDCNNQRKREYYAKNRAAALNQKKEYYKNNKQEIKEKGQKWNRENQERKRKYNQEYYQKHKEKIIANVVSYELKRVKHDPIFRARKNLRRRVSDIIKEKSFSPKSSKILGANLQEFKSHIESLWKEGMNWKNYGYYGWHIDHIIPLSSAKTLEELEKLCHYTNLQPLWAKDNLKKSNKQNT